MARPQRIRLIKEIGRRMESSVICYITGDRENLGTRIAPDVIPVFHRQLEKMTGRGRIDLFLYTRGGDVITPWRLAQLIREYSPEFRVLVPYRAYSAGTLLCLGADQIIMGVMGELGPIDPSVINAYNPEDPGNPTARMPVSIEDVYSYLALAGEIAGMDADAMCRVFSILAERIHPLALGNVHRNYLLIRSLANKLLGLRKNRLDSDNESRIINNLTEKLYAHDYTISRREAADDIGLPVVCPDRDVERLIWVLYDDFARELNLAEPFDPRDLINTGQRREFEVTAGVVETEFSRDCFSFSGVVERKFHHGNSEIDVEITKQGWRTLE